jgi:hypothetical protein
MRDTGVPHVMEFYHNLSLYWGIIQFIHPELTLIVDPNETISKAKYFATFHCLGKGG